MSIEKLKQEFIKKYGDSYQYEIMLLDANPTRGIQFALYDQTSISLFNEEQKLLWKRNINGIETIEVDHLNNSSHEHMLILHLKNGIKMTLSHTGRTISSLCNKILDSRYQDYVDSGILGATHYDYEPIIPIVYSVEIKNGYYKVDVEFEILEGEQFMLFDRNGLCIYEGTEEKITIKTVMYQTGIFELRSRSDVNVKSVQITEITTQNVIHFIGDSTLANQQRLPLYGWAQLHPLYTSKIVNNLAYSARSLKSFCFEGRFNQLLNEIKPGDTVVIGFGHNDARTTFFGSKTEEYIEYLKYYIEQIQHYGALPIVTIPIAQRHYDKEKKLINTHENYEKAILKEIKGVKIINLNKMLMEEINRLGYEKSKKLFNNHECLELIDNTHLSKIGAKLVNELFIKEAGHDL